MNILLIVKPADLLPRGGDSHFNTTLYRSPIELMARPDYLTVSVVGDWTVAEWDQFIAACQAHRADLAFFEEAAERAEREAAHHDNLPAA